ncbi:hypothetical protein GCM10009850_066760 [Nonomuraea monospora]|uniref:Transposase n=1 Tax=Nonomuraea monospora TaxID=568818 RepID=A0ABP5PHK0_9ACTN
MGAIVPSKSKKKPDFVHSETVADTASAKRRGAREVIAMLVTVEQRGRIGQTPGCGVNVDWGRVFTGRAATVTGLAS